MDRCATLEQRLCREQMWRSQAENQISSMAARGKVLEQERSRLLHDDSDLQKAEAQRCKALSDTVRKEQQESRHAQAKADALEEGNIQLAAELRAEQRYRCQAAKKHSQSLAAKVEHLQALHDETGISTDADTRAVEAARCDFDATLSRERDRARNEHEGIRRKIFTMELELRSLQCSREAAVQAAETERINVHASLKRELQRREAEECTA